MHEADPGRGAPDGADWGDIQADAEDDGVRGYLEVADIPGVTG